MFRIVHNEQTDLYRVEKRGPFGWSFVDNPDTHDYLNFDDLDSARAWICQQTQKRTDRNRRWKVVSDCA